MTSSLANNVISLIQDMAVGNLSEGWTNVTKAAIAEAILALTKLDETLRVPQPCIKTPAVSETIYLIKYQIFFIFKQYSLCKDFPLIIIWFCCGYRA